MSPNTFTQYLRKMALFLMALVCYSSLFAQNKFDVSDQHPFGLPNPEAPEAITDYKELIGMCNCLSTSRLPNGDWAEPVDMTWEFKYIMNGMAVQDQTLKADGKHSGSIRQFNADSASWYVHYYASSAASMPLPSWKGAKRETDIVLYRAQKAPNGSDGFYRLTFSDISDQGFKWQGAWVSTDESVVYPTWKIDCEKQNTP